MQLNEELKNKLIAIAAIAAMVLGLVMFFFFGPEHIEDTNGPDNFALQTLTEQQIIDLSYGSVGGPHITNNILMGDMLTFSAEKFTGVSEILYDNYILPSDFEVTLYNFEVFGGNFKLVVVHENTIIAELEPGIDTYYRIEDITGYVSLRIVGESAAFRFSMTQSEYDLHSHLD